MVTSFVKFSDVNITVMVLQPFSLVVELVWAPMRLHWEGGSKSPRGGGRIRALDVTGAGW